uniref:Uncharacterized protein n=1 Tax=Strongyloides stercoralis TaxID=6248 RepID=A0A0K0DS01_STRER
MRTAALRTTLADEFLIEFAEIEAAAILIRETEGKFERSKIAKTKIIAKNTFAAEMIALLEGVEVTVYLEKVMKFLIENYKEKPTLFTNDIPVLEPTAKHFDISTKSRSLRIDFAYVKNNLKFIGLKAIHLENIITDVLTKKNIKNKIKNFWMTKQNNGKPEEAEEVFEHKL